MKTLISLHLILMLLYGAAWGKLDLYMADPEVRIAQKVYCQIFDITPADKLRAVFDNVIIFQKEGQLQPEEVFIADYRNQKAGRHNLVVSILNENNELKESITKTWTTLHDGIPIVGIDENNSIRFQGELFFPVYALLDGPSLIDYWVQNGYVNANANCRWLPNHPNFSDYTLEEYRNWLDHCYNLGIGIIGPANRWAGIGESQLGKGNDTTIMKDYVRNLKDHPGILMWQWADEPDGGGATNCAYPDEVRSWTDVCHRYDTNHPHTVNLTAYAWARDGAWYTEHCGDYSYLYGADWHKGDKKLVGDIIGFDFYPIEFASKIPEEFGDLQVSFVSMGKALDRIAEWNHHLCPIFSWNEPCDLNPDSDGDGYADGHLWSPYLWTPPPTPKEFWAEYWLKIIHGVKGINLHPYFDPAGTAFPPYNHLTMAEFLKWMEALKHGVLGADYEGRVIDEELFGGQIDILAKTYNDTLFLLAGNAQYQKERARFFIDFLSNDREIKVFGEGRSVYSQEGFFEDDFDSLAIHIYKIVEEPITAVDLIDIQGQLVNGNVQLTWKPSLMNGPLGVEIQKSPLAPLKFHTIAFVKIDSLARISNNYCFTDQDVLPGIYLYRLKIINNDGSFYFSDILKLSIQSLKSISLSQNYPNPFNGSTIISYMIPANSQVELKIYDITGHQVDLLVDKYQTSGCFNVVWNARNYASGPYFCHLAVGSFHQTQKMLLLK